MKLILLDMLQKEHIKTSNFSILMGELGKEQRQELLYLVEGTLLRQILFLQVLVIPQEHYSSILQYLIVLVMVLPDLILPHPESQRQLVMWFSLRVPEQPQTPIIVLRQFRQTIRFQLLRPQETL